MGFSDLEIIPFCFINISCCTTLPFHLELYEVSFFKQLPGGYKGEKIIFSLIMEVISFFLSIF